MGLEQAPSITLEMFKPLNRSRQAEQDYACLMKYYFGEAGGEFAEGLREGSFNSSHVPLFRERIDPYFRRVFARTYPHSADITIQSSYMESQRIARQVVRDCVFQIYPNFADDLFSNEVTLESPSPTDFFYYLVKDESESLTASFETRRHLLLLLGAASIDSASGNGELATQLMDINRLFDDELFIPGSRKQTAVFAHYDPETYGVKQVVLQRPKYIPDDVLLREHSLTLREIEGVGLVQTRMRQKDTAAAEIKMIAYAAVEDGILDPSKVKDYMGFTLITFNDKETSFGQDAVDLLIENVGGLLRIKRSVTRFEEDNGTGKNRGQGGVNNKRRQAYLPDFPDHPLEIQFYKAKDYLTASHETGLVNPKTGFYTGCAHRLFSLRRIAEVLPVVRPQEVYGGNPQKDLINRMHAVAEEIRNTETEGIQEEPTGNSKNYIKNRRLARPIVGMLRLIGSKIR